MGVLDIEKASQCPYCGKQQTCEEIQKLTNMRDTGLNIYCRTDWTSDVDQGGAVGQKKSTPQDAFIVHNTNNVNITHKLDKNKITCPRCKKILENTHKLINKSSCLDLTEVMGICDHCLLQAQTPILCDKCEKLLKTLILTHDGQMKDSSCFIKLWLSKKKRVLDAALSKPLPKKKIRSISEIHISDTFQLNLDQSKSVSEHKIQQMFHSEPSLLDDEYTALEKRLGNTVNFTKPMIISNLIAKERSESDNNVNRDQESYNDKKNAAYSILKHIPKEEVSQQVIKTKEARLKEYQKILEFKTQQNDSYLGDDVSIFFPEVTQIALPTSKQYSSSEIIKHTQEKLRLKAEENEKKARAIEEQKNAEKREKEIERSIIGTSQKPVMRPMTDLNRRGTSSFHEVEDNLRDSKLNKTLRRSESNMLSREKTTQLAKNEKDLLKMSQAISKQRISSSKNILEISMATQELTQKKQDLTKHQQYALDKKKSSTKDVELQKLNKPDLIKMSPEFAKKKQKVSNHILNLAKMTEEKVEASQSKLKEKLVKPKKTKELKEKELKMAQIKLRAPSTNDLVSDLVNVKKGTIEKGQHLLSSKKPEILNKIPDLAKSKQRSSKVTLNKEKMFKEKREIIEAKEDTSVKYKTEDSKRTELKMNQVKLRKVSSDDLVSQLAKVATKKDLMKLKNVDKTNKSSENVGRHEIKSKEKRDIIQSKETSKSAKLKKIEESKEIELKMSQVKLLKASTDDLGKQLIKVKNNVSEKVQVRSGSKSKEPALMEKQPKLGIKRSENVLNLDKIPKDIREIQQPEKMNKSVKVRNTAEIKENELKINQVKLRKPSIDNVILKLIQLKKAITPVKREIFQAPSIMLKISKKLEARISLRLKLKIDSESDFEICESTKRSNFIGHIIIGETIQKHIPLLNLHSKEKKTIPIFFHTEYIDKSPLPALKKVERSATEVESKIKIEPEVNKGIMRYALSDRSFIEKGWTMLPMEKIVRKMNVYRMRPAQPEFDWFEHHKKKGLIEYDTGEKLAEVYDNGRGRWYYKNGRLALDYYEAEETNAQQRFVLYSSGELDERGRSYPITILATFDHLGNGIVFDHAGKIRLKYNQTEGVLLDRSIGPVTHWQWHTLNDPPILQQVMIDTQMPIKDTNILKMGGPADNKIRPDNEEMLAIEFDNFIKDKSKKLKQKFKPFQIKMKALKINEHFSLRVLDQATIYLIFRDGSANLKLNIGMVLDHKEIVDTDIAEVGEVSNSLERFPARTDSLAGLQRSVAFAQRYEKLRAERDRSLRRPEPCSSIDQLGAAASRPLRPPFRTLATPPTGSMSSTRCRCSSNLYYNSRLL